MANQKKLHLSWWQEMTYLLLSIGGPLLTIYLAAIIHNPKPKYIAFMTLFFLGVIAWIAINKLIITPWKIKINSQIATLELNYQTRVGSENETKEMWKGLQLKKFIWDGGSILFFAFVTYYLLVGVAAWIDHLTLYSMIILLCVLVGLLFRLVCFMGLNKKEETNQTQETQG